MGKERGFMLMVKLQIAGITARFASSMPCMDETIKISFGPFDAHILQMGATLSRFRYSLRDLLLGFNQPENHHSIPIYAGAIVGPIANRIAHGRVQIGSKTHQMPRNENGETTLHSGNEGVHARRWDIVRQDIDRVELECVLPNGACGLPGNRVISTEYRMDENGLQVKITATTDARTPINIAHHPYWVLGTDQAQTKLEIAARHYLPVNKLGIPSGTIQPLENTPFDFRFSKKIGATSKLDHNFCLATHRHAAPVFAARLIAPDGLTLTIETTETGLQVYAGSGLPELSEQMTFGAKCQPNAAIALEPQAWPDAPRNPNFPNIFIEIGETYQQVTRYKICTQTDASNLP